MTGATRRLGTWRSFCLRRCYRVFLKRKTRSRVSGIALELHFLSSVIRCSCVLESDVAKLFSSMV
jgi:hypothetical protein